MTEKLCAEHGAGCDNDTEDCYRMSNFEADLCGPAGTPGACSPGCCQNEGASFLAEMAKRAELSATTPEPDYRVEAIEYVATNVSQEVATALSSCRQALEAGHTLVALPFQPNQEQVALLHRIANAPESVLMEAERITNGQRQKDYGTALDNHERIAEAWNAYLKHDPDQRFGLSPNLLPEDVACLMILLKVARYQVSRTRDSVVDMAGYANVLDKMVQQRAARAGDMADEL